MIKMILDEEGRQIPELQIVNLVDDVSRYIVKVLSEKEAHINIP